jgi:hypothetical protein
VIGFASARRWSVEPREDGSEPRRDIATLEIGYDAARLKPSRCESAVAPPRAHGRVVVARRL